MDPKSELEITKKSSKILEKISKFFLIVGITCLIVSFAFYQRKRLPDCFRKYYATMPNNTQNETSLQLNEIKSTPEALSEMVLLNKKQLEVLNDINKNLEKLNKMFELELVKNATVDAQTVEAANETSLQQNLAPNSGPKSCQEILMNGLSHGYGFYLIYPRNESVFNVFCDMETGGGGWTVFQQRGLHLKLKRGSFNRSWEEYRNGFENVENDYWLGLENIYALTKDSSDHELLVQMEQWGGTKTFAIYLNFSISSEKELYKIQLGQFQSSLQLSESLDATVAAEDGLKSGLEFQTFDKNSQKRGNCNKDGGWWYNEESLWGCEPSNLNGNYANDFSGTMYWGSDAYNSFKKTEMKFRRKL